MLGCFKTSSDCLIARSKHDQSFHALSGIQMDMTAGMRREILEIENDLTINEVEKAQRKQEVLQRRLGGNNGGGGGGGGSTSSGGMAVPLTGSVGSGGSVFARHHRLSSTSSGISSSSALGGSRSPLNGRLGSPKTHLFFIFAMDVDSTLSDCIHRSNSCISSFKVSISSFKVILVESVNL